MLRMTRTSTVLSILILFLHTTFGESGYTSADGDGTFGDDEPDNFDIDCFSQLEFKDSYSSLTCNFTELPPHNTNYTLAVWILAEVLWQSTNTRGAEMEEQADRFPLLKQYHENLMAWLTTDPVYNANEVNRKFLITVRDTKEDSSYLCFNMEKQEDVYFLQFTDILSNKDICVEYEIKRRVCRSLIITDIVKPEVPFDINITYQKEANEYLIHYSTPHSRKKYLKDKLIHQIAYRQEENSWKTIESPYLQIKLLGKNLETDALYEVKVRSQPNGDYFKGVWSEWSTSKSFRTTGEHSTESYSSMFMIILSIPGFILSVVMIVLILTFWESRIKPVVWPNLPDHKITLERLCKKPKNNFDISFNPESFGYVFIHEVDGIQAKAEQENFLQPPSTPETDIPPKFRSGSELKRSPARTDKSSPNLSMNYGGIWSAEALHGFLGSRQSTDTADICSSGMYEVCHSSRVPLCDNGFHLPSAPPLDPPGQPGPQPQNGNVVPPNSELKSPSDEEAYVTMSSFYKNQ